MPRLAIRARTVTIPAQAHHLRKLVPGREATKPKIGNRSAVPALAGCDRRGAQSTCQVMSTRQETRRQGVDGDELVRQTVRDSGRLAESPVIERSTLTIGADGRLGLPVGCGPISQMRMERGARALMLFVGNLVMITELDNRNEPVPVQDGHVVVQIGRWVPAQEVIVVDTNLVGGIMVANVVIVGLGQRHMHDTENHNTDSQVASPSPESTPPKIQRLASCRRDQRSQAQRRLGATRERKVAAKRALGKLSRIMNQQPEPVKRCVVATAIQNQALVKTNAVIPRSFPAPQPRAKACRHGREG